MNLFKLGACMLADVALTVATGGIYLLTRNGYDSTSFTGDELYYQRQKENFEVAVRAYKNLRGCEDDKYNL